MPHTLKIVLCLFLAFSAAAAQNDGTAAFAPPRYRVVAAKFVQIRHLEELDMDVESRGSMVSELDGRLRWQVDAPVKSVTLIERDKLTHYDGETGRTAVIETEKFPWLELLREALQDWFSGDRERLARRFQVTSPRPETLLLVPRDAALKTLCREVEIVFSPRGGIVERVRITENSGDTMEMRFSEIELDPKLPPNTWQMPER